MSRENVVDAKFWLQFRPILNFFFVLAFVYGYGTLYDVGFVLFYDFSFTDISSTLHQVWNIKKCTSMRVRICKSLCFHKRSGIQQLSNIFL